MSGEDEDRKKCLTCGEIKLISTFTRYPDCKPSDNNPVYDYCRPCRYEYRGRKHRHRPMPDRFKNQEGWT